MIIENHKRHRGMLAFFLSCVFLSGCSLSSFRAKPRATITTPQGTKIEQSGNAETPSHVESGQTTTTVPLSANSQVSIVAATPDKPASVTVTSPAPAPLVQVATLETATAPKAFTPPAPPTPAQLAQGDGVRVFYYLAAGLALLALVLGYAGHVKAAGFAAAGAIGIPFAIHFLNTLAASFVGVASVCIAGSLFATWFLVKQHPELIAEARTKIETEIALAKSKL
jgi:hypothetical protein